MDLMLKPSMLYTFVVLIPWCILYIPRYLRLNRPNMIYASIVVQLLAYGFLFKVSNPGESWNYMIFASVSLVGFLAIGGYVQHWANEKYKSK